MIIVQGVFLSCCIGALTYAFYILFEHNKRLAKIISTRFSLMQQREELMNKLLGEIIDGLEEQRQEIMAQLKKLEPPKRPMKKKPSPHQKG